MSTDSTDSPKYNTSRSAANSVMDVHELKSAPVLLEQLAQGLPPKLAVSMHEGNPYYYHVDSCEVSWTRPGDADLPRGYSKIIDPVSGKEYYVVDDGSKEVRTTWTLPSRNNSVWDR